MKPTTALKPLVFALAAVMAMAAQADSDKKHPHKPQGPTWQDQLQIGAGATAISADTQNSEDNYVNNQATKNNAKSDNSFNSNSGNVGGNNAAGDGNQQANNAAIATADEAFVFGSANALALASQNNVNNYVKNASTQNRAQVDNSVNSNSGNIGFNNAAGNFNQQKNDLAIAVSGGRVANAVSGASQNSTDLGVNNKADRENKVVSLSGGAIAGGSYKGTIKGTIKDDKGGYYDDKGGSGSGGNKGQKVDLVEQGNFLLGAVWTQQVLVKDGWKNPVVNNATTTGSVNSNSGNVGYNNAAGVGNQQVNSMSIAAGCNACPAGN